MFHSHILLLFFTLFLFVGCKPDPHPSHPDYSITKPKVRYAPSQKSLEKMVKNLQGKPYVWAEEGPHAFDCSGYIYYMYGSMGIEIPRVAREQAKKGKKIAVDNLQYGDLLFFDTQAHRRGHITHVGMYLGDGWFTHASTKKNEVVYSKLNKTSYYKKRLRICRRYLPQHSITKNATPHQRNKSSSVSKKESIDKSSASTITYTKANRPQRGHFYLQIGSFKGRVHPSILDKITHSGYTYKVLSFTQNNQRVSKLLIGGYSSREKAKAQLPTIRQEIEKGAFVVQIR